MAEVVVVAEGGIGIGVNLMLTTAVEHLHHLLLVLLTFGRGVEHAAGNEPLRLRRGKRQRLRREGPVVGVGLQIVAQHKGMSEVQLKRAPCLQAGLIGAHGTTQTVDESTAGCIAAEHADDVRLAVG